jgi:hypothetical protein
VAVEAINKTRTAEARLLIDFIVVVLVFPLRPSVPSAVILEFHRRRHEGTQRRNGFSWGELARAAMSKTRC